MELVIAKDRQSLGSFAAADAAQCLRQALADGQVARIVVATGSSQFEVLDALINEKDIDWSRVEAFHLDEYIGLSVEHPASFCGYLKKRFVDRVNLKAFYYLNGTDDPKEACKKATIEVQRAPIDLALVGIGENAHLAFNDPPADFETRDAFRVVQLDDACRKQQVGEGWFDQIDHVPRRAISMSIRQIMAARKIICSVPDRRKAEAVLACIEGLVDPMTPASILQEHEDCTIYLDAGSAALLSTAVQRLASMV